MVELEQIVTVDSIDGDNNNNKEHAQQEQKDQTCKRIVIACVHLNWEHENLKLLQTIKLLEELTAFRHHIEKHSENESPPAASPHHHRLHQAAVLPPPPPVILCGDFNSDPASAVYGLLTQGKAKLAAILSRSLRNKLERRHVLPHTKRFEPMVSTYREVLGKEPPYTNYKPDWKATLDYIFYCSGSNNNTKTKQKQEEEDHICRPNVTQLRPVQVLDVPSEDLLLSLGTLPNRIFSSDHLMLWCKFSWAHYSGAAATADASNDERVNE